ncbi:MAG: inositol monophosphatase [Verrucomicrobia bacterium]|nr:inositol monophosphatase [Verrucomicrobiota bacterium]
MKSKEMKQALDCAVKAAIGAGRLMRENLNKAKRVTHEQQHDIKLELDVRCQKLIEKRLRSGFGDISVLGEEGTLGDPCAPKRWVVDPIDGTVNFTYGIPHACVSIALQVRNSRDASGASSATAEPYETCLGVVYDPFCDELWTAQRGRPAYLNGKRIRASRRSKLSEAIMSVGFAKYPETLEATLPTLNHLIYRVRKIRIMGAAALGLVYVATGRFDAYIESGIRLWDIAAGGLILECAGGEFWRKPLAGEHAYKVIANNGLFRRRLQQMQSRRVR